ncbi:MAG: hypothetical protein IK082_01830 [Oscillospiraceae bacterium]|nr:hypothetical protein [Oscillospiraceae bacterium]
MGVFEPLALNDENVEAVFDRCLASDDTPEEDRAECMAFLGVCGYAREVFKKTYFSKTRMAEDKKNIYYLYGQLAGVHEPEDVPSARRPTITVGGCARDYRGKQWFSEKKSLLMLLYVGSVFLCDTPLSGFTSKAYTDALENNINGRMPEPQKRIALEDAAFLSDGVVPTLSPDDPAFTAWWEGHKAEWE